MRLRSFITNFTQSIKRIFVKSEQTKHKMPGGQGAKDLNPVENKQPKQANGAQQKKKRPRQRQRPRNKAQIANAQAAGSSDITAAPTSAVIESLVTGQVTLSPGKSPGNETRPIAETLTKSLKTVLKADSAITPNNCGQNITHKQTVPQFRQDIYNNSNDKLKEPLKMNSSVVEASSKSREAVLAEREAKKLAKQAKKVKALGDASLNLNENCNSNSSSTNVKLTVCDPTSAVVTDLPQTEKTRDEIKAEREAKKQAKQAQKLGKSAGAPVHAENAATVFGKESATLATTPNESITSKSEEKKKPALSKAERRAIQEAQRAAKANAQALKIAPKIEKSGTPLVKKATSTISDTVVSPSAVRILSSNVRTTISKDCKVKLFNHLESACKNVTLFVNNSSIHPTIARLGEQYAKRTVVGSNARCIAFLNALKMVIKDFETPLKKEFGRSMETTITNCVDYLQKCRPLAVSVSNAYKHIKHMLTQLPTDKPESDLKVILCRFIDTYIENQIGKAAEAISYSMQEKISNGDVILTFGCSSLITYIFEEAQRRQVDFRVVVVDSRPFCEGQELLRRLAAKEIPCTYVLINAVSFVMPEATKVLLGAHALLSNGYVMARTGTAQVALVAHSFNVPVLVCCETHKFSERFQTDAIVYNELGNPDDLILSDKCCLTNWKAKSKMSPLNLMYDITPPELVTAVVTEVSILPCTSVPVILRIKPTEIGYY